MASLRGHGHRFKVSQPSAGCAFVKLRSEEKGSQASSKFPAWSSPSASLCVLLPEPFCRTLMAVFAFHTQFKIVKECDPSSNLEAANKCPGFRRLESATLLHILAPSHISWDSITMSGATSSQNFLHGPPVTSLTMVPSVILPFDRPC